MFGLLIKGNRRDRVDLGTVDPYGVIAYPVEDDKGNLNLDRMAQQRVGRPHNIEAFRNINMSAPHFAPGMVASTGQQRDNTGILSVQRGNKTMAVANAFHFSELMQINSDRHGKEGQNLVDRSAMPIETPICGLLVI